MGGNQNHANNCDLNGMMGAMKMVGAQLLNIVAWNVPFGPRQGERLRQHQMRACLTKLFADNIPAVVPLFGRHAGGILSCLARMDVCLSGVDDPEVEAWNWMSERAKLQPVTTRRTHMSRFSSAPHSLITHADAWDICEFETTYCCLEMDMLGSTKLAKRLKNYHEAGAAAGDGGDGGGGDAVGAV